jgi:hypothetical protein
MAEYTKLNRDEVLRYTIPRMEETVTDVAKRKSLDLDKNKAESALMLKRHRLELERTRTQFDRTEDRLKKLEGDREMMTVKSPADGVVYYGKCVRGRFADAMGMTDNLSRNGQIQPNQVFMTVVEPRPMVLRATISESELQYCRPGLAGIATPPSSPDTKLKATLDDISDIPISPGSFNAQFLVDVGPKNKWLMPGMTCKIKVTPYKKADALAVPLKAIMTEELDDEAHYVWLVKKDGKPEKRPVTLGKKTDKLQEIATGVAEGDKVLLEAPKDDKDK